MTFPHLNVTCTRITWQGVTRVLIARDIYGDLQLIDMQMCNRIKLNDTRELTHF